MAKTTYHTGFTSGRAKPKGMRQSKVRLTQRAGSKGKKTLVGLGLMPAKALHSSTLVGGKVGAVRSKLGLSQPEFGRVIGYSTRSVAGWEAGKTLGPAVRQKLTETERLYAALAELMPSEALGDWLRTPNEAFERHTPLELIERGESDRLWQMIFEIDANVAN